MFWKIDSSLNRKNVDALLHRFASTRPDELTLDQCSRMMNYVECVECVFNRVAGSNGHIGASALSPALVASGFKMISGGNGNSDFEKQVATEIITSYSNGNAMCFQQFLNFRLHWDHYISQWEKVMNPGNHHMTQAQLQEILENFQQGLTDHSVQINKVFSNQTLTKLMNRFTLGPQSPVGTFEQFCMMMDFVHHHADLFAIADANNNGVLGKAEFGNVCNHFNIPVAIGLQQWDEDKNQTIEFDEFLMMMMNLNLTPSAVRRRITTQSLI
jgi:hypothetical protein